MKSPWCQYCAILGLWKAQYEDRWGWGGFLLWLQRGGRVYITISRKSRNKIEFTINFCTLIDYCRSAIRLRYGQTLLNNQELLKKCQNQFGIWAGVTFPIWTMSRRQGVFSGIPSQSHLGLVRCKYHLCRYNISRFSYQCCSFLE